MKSGKKIYVFRAEREICFWWFDLFYIFSSDLVSSDLISSEVFDSDRMGAVNKNYVPVKNSRIWMILKFNWIDFTVHSKKRRDQTWQATKPWNRANVQKQSLFCLLTQGARTLGTGETTRRQVLHISTILANFSKTHQKPTKIFIKSN